MNLEQALRDAAVLAEKEGHSNICRTVKQLERELQMSVQRQREIYARQRTTAELNSLERR